MKIEPHFFFEKKARAHKIIGVLRLCHCQQSFLEWWHKRESTEKKKLERKEGCHSEEEILISLIKYIAVTNEKAERTSASCF